MPNYQCHSLRKYGPNGSDDTYAIDVVCNTNAIKKVPSEKQTVFIEYIVRSVRNQDGFDLSPSYTIPKIVNDYKDGPVRMCKLTTMDQQTLPPTRTYSRDSTYSRGSTTEINDRSYSNDSSVSMSEMLQQEVFESQIHNDTQSEKCEYISIKNKKEIVYDSRKNSLAMDLQNIKLEPSFIISGNIYLFGDNFCCEWTEVFVILNSTTMSFFVGDDNDKVCTRSIRKALGQMYTREEFVTLLSTEDGNPNIQIGLTLPENMKYIMIIDTKEISKENKKIAKNAGEAAVPFNRIHIASSEQEIIKNWGFIISQRTELIKPGDHGYEPEVLKGYLTKQGHVMKTWTKRFFVLAKGYVKYYVDEKLSIEKGTFGIVLCLGSCFICVSIFTMNLLYCIMILISFCFFLFFNFVYIDQTLIRV